ncbi:ABC transporter substrate-binding protein [Notoacmeibacter sp. MSK16QG-6]|uniref:substrate-binding periplasmic protein n=1 Tax=Notoacmeibacter sp. MSK16QG-6 TaxID=2957982 RepID=UPI00209F32D5|nr:transporter substrate-binding domain-containing protein [Notoacmeibacter sp. MSK16QG-6]MCP1200826.1 transporter substrate-binding domain-containing protein [Notoacmeibacter sp. MSK16QG-6]
MMRWLLLALLMVWAQFASAQNCRDMQFGDQAPRPPQNASRDIIGQSLDQIVERGWILFAVYEDFPPFVFTKDGKRTGIDIELGELIADALGVEARFNVVQADENVDADLRNHVWRGTIVSGRISNVMLHIPYDRELQCRNELVVLTGHYFNEEIAIAYRKDDYPDGGPTPPYFRYDTVGVENDSLSDFYLSGMANGQIVPNMTRYTSTEAAMAGLKNAEVKAVMGPLTQLQFGKDETIAVHQPPLVGLARGNWTLGVAVRHNWRPLSYAVDDAIRAAVEDGRMARIFNRYGVDYNKPEW